jgi:N-acetylglucosaminyl-diphospho-decaprenol L-rhamnosyltransferase
MNNVVPKSVSVVVVTFNSRSIVAEALSSLSGQPTFQLVIVDNASADGTSKFIRDNFKDASLIQMPTNVGFAKAVNEGVRQAEHDVILLLNPDAAVSPAVVRELASNLEDESVGVIAPLLRNPGSSQRVVPAGFMPTIRRMAAHYSGLSRLGRRWPFSRGHYLFDDQLEVGHMDVDWVTGACVAFTRDTWARVGGLSERWFMYAEDIDFCHRVQKQGLRVVLDTKAHADHLVGQSDSTSSFRSNASWVVNLRDFYTTELARFPWQSVLWSAAVGVGLWSRAAAFWLLSWRGRPDARRRRQDDARRFAHYGRAILRTAGSTRHG